MEKETEWLDGDVGRKKEEQRWVGCEGVEGGGGGGACKRRNKSTQSHWWQTAAAVSLGILSRSSSSEQSADAG